MKLIVFELNEVPSVILEDYISRNRNCNLSKVFEGLICQTITEDSGELHPWQVWPSVHHGVYSDVHGIDVIGQDTDHIYPWPGSVWHELTLKGLKVGLFNVPQTGQDRYKSECHLFVPDSFSSSAYTIPKEITGLTEANLFFCSRSKRSSTRSQLKPDSIKRIVSYLITRPRFVLSLLAQLIKERVSKTARIKRGEIQDILLFPEFIKQLESIDLDVSFYHTNTVAAVMHRYWDKHWQVSNKKEQSPVESALDRVDEMIGKLLSFSSNENSSVMVISGLGQEPIKRNYGGEFVIVSHSKFISGLTAGHKLSTLEVEEAMHPDYGFRTSDKSLRDLVSKFVSQNPAIFTHYKERGDLFSVRLATPLGISRGMEVRLMDGRVVKACDIGLEVVRHDPGTAYHSPYGVFGIWSPTGLLCPTTFSKKECSSRDQVIPIRDVREIIVSIAKS